MAAVRSVLAGLTMGVAICVAQITGDIEVRVVDASRAAVVNASVVARSWETSALRKGHSNEYGEARFRQMPAGSYEITVEAPGFRPRRSDLHVSTGAVAELALSL